MKKILTYFFLASLVIFAGCEKEENIEAPGNIPGMGDAAGELQADPFNVPEGIVIESVEGELASILENEGSAALKSATDVEANQSYSCYGSGGKFIKVRLTLTNTSNFRRSVFLPRGLMFKVKKDGYQHGILLQWTWVCLQPGQTRTIVLNLYCLNRGFDSSTPAVGFSIAGISNSQIMWRLLRRLARKKINFEHYNVVSSSAALKGSTDAPRYGEIIEVLQKSVWALTNGTGLSDEQIQIIESIPEVEVGSYPEALEDNTLELPVWWDEYSIPEE